ncbi:MAG TPA: MaoC family dehydratase N-terminal domain-containing protein [Candidatus Dormibacteraeota bacterium]
MPNSSHIGRRYEAPGQVIDAERAGAFARAISGPGDGASAEDVPPTFAAAYCLFPTLALLFTDPDVEVNLAGLIHGEQSFEWPVPVHAGEVVDSSAEIVGVEEKRGMTFLTLDVESRRPADGAVVCRGRSLMIIRGAPS